jgi:uncharacterized protein
MYNPNSMAPLIWFNNLDFDDGDNGGDCNCDCGIAIQTSELRYGWYGNEIAGGLFYHSRPLHIAMCDEDHWLVCNPTGTGQVAVLNCAAMHLFNQFQIPTSLNQARQVLADWSPELLETTVTQFIRLGLLEEVSNPVPGHQWGQAQTLTAWLHVTNECNLRCPYCYLHKTPEDMSDDTARRAVEAVFRSAQRHRFGRVKLKYAGGEASLHIGQVLATHDYAAKLAHRQGIELEAVILSNGVALSRPMIAELLARDIKVMISLDGVGAYHDAQRTFINGRGSFQQVDRSIERLLAGGVTPHISITVTDRNLDGLPELMKYVLARDLTFSINYYRENECSVATEDLRYGEEQMIETMEHVFAIIEQNLPRRSLLGCLVDRANLSMPHQRTCGVGQNYLVIDQHGGIAKCQMEITNTVTTIEAEDPLQMIRDDRLGIQNLPVEAKEGCRTCEWRYWCTGGCPLLTYRATGRYDVKSPNCNIYQALYPEVLRLEALRLLKYEQPWQPDIMIGLGQMQAVLV